MKPKYLNNLIEESYSLFSRMKSGIRKAGLVALAGAIIGVGLYGCKKEEPQKEDISSIESVEKEPAREYTPPKQSIVQQPEKEESLPRKSGSLEENYKKQADEQVYKIIETKWQEDFGPKTNYRISDVPAGPNDLLTKEILPVKEGVLSLTQAISIATAQNREYQTQKEQLYLTALDLTSQQHEFEKQSSLQDRNQRIATEQLTQAEQDVLYQIRSFNRFRKTFVVSIVSDYYQVLQQRQAVQIARNLYNVEVELEKRVEMKAEASSKPHLEVDQAKQSELTARNNYIKAQQRYLQELDAFKIRLALPTDARISLDVNELKALMNVGISTHNYTLEAAVETALSHRLDFANSEDQIEDAKRKVIVAKADLSLDSISECNAYRKTLITLSQKQRQYQENINQVKLEVRKAYRQLQEKAESYQIQKESLELAENTVKTNAKLLENGQASIRVLLESQNSLLQAQNALTKVLIGHTIAKLEFFRDIGILQVRPDGSPFLSLENKTNEKK